jgi:hypothetical protein
MEIIIVLMKVSYRMRLENVVQLCSSDQCYYVLLALLEFLCHFLSLVANYVSSTPSPHSLVSKIYV